jgi:hypothetical protein
MTLALDWMQLWQIRTVSVVVDGARCVVIVGLMALILKPFWTAGLAWRKIEENSAFAELRTRSRRLVRVFAHQAATMFKIQSVIVLILALSVGGCALPTPGSVIRIATGNVSHILCSMVFVSALDPDQVYADALRPEPGMGLIDWAMHREVDRVHRRVTANFAGMFTSEAVYHEGRGCTLVYGATGAGGLPMNAPLEAKSSAQAVPEIAGSQIVEAADSKLRLAVEHAFADSESAPVRRTKAVVVVHDGHLIAERYAPGYGIDTPLLGNSATKSVTSALIGILVRQGHLSLHEPAPVPSWTSSGDPRHMVTIDELLRMTSGLPPDERRGAFDLAPRMWYLRDDMGSFAESEQPDAKPGVVWHYSNAGYQILSQIIRDAVGGRGEDVTRFAHDELFAPLGMRTATLELDGTGAPIGSKFMLASARDWARFGMLYLNDGIANGRLILPEGWVRYSASPTLDTGYGAGFWTNTNPGTVPGWGAPWGLPGVPRDTFFARGYLGQYVVVVPSEQLVVVRFGFARKFDDAEGVAHLVAEVIEALHGGH